MLKNITYLTITVAGLLLIPLIGMRLDAGVVWTGLDFAIAGSLLFCIGFLYILLTRKEVTTKYRVIVGGALALVLLVVWAQLAVGIF